MKITFFFLLFGIVTAFSNNNYSQNTLFTFNMGNYTIEEVLSAIEKNSEFVFFFSDKVNRELSKKVSIKSNNQTLEEILNEIFDSTDLKFTIHDRQVSISSKASKENEKQSNISGQQQAKRIITGKVIEASGEPLIGVSIRIRGTTTGAISDADGKFSIEAGTNDVLIISHIGFISQEIRVTNQSAINITMQEEVTTIEDIVIVGYGTQKKETVTGSVSAITTKDLLQSPQANISNALAGRLPGLLSVQRSGEPGNDMSTLRIRGVGTFAGENSQEPLIMVDGIESSNFNNIDPNEIESLSILKDASSTAVYGVRGANGVILITTKRGTLGKPKINFSSNVAATNFPFLREPMNSYDYTTSYNQGQKYDYYSTGNYTPKYTDVEFEKYRTNSDPIFYPSTNWYDLMLKDFSYQTQSNLSIGGGTEKVKYFVSLGYFTQAGMLNTKIYDPGYDYQIDYKRYNLRSNFDINVTNNLLLSLDISTQMGNLQSPNWNTRQMMEMLSSIAPNASPGVIDNKIVTILESFGSTTTALTPFNKGWNTKYENNLNGSTRFNYKMDYLLKGFSLRGAISYRNFSTETKAYQDGGVTWDAKTIAPGEVVYVPSTDPGVLRYEGTSNKNIRVYMEAGAEYNRKFGYHAVTGLILYNQGKYYSPNLEFLVPNGHQGIVGRVTYNFRNRYLAEFNIGYNGTENFAPGKRFGVFPAYSLGWVITEESFFPENKYLTFLKARGSYGIVGNDKIGGDRFLYRSTAYTYTSGTTGYYFGEVGSSYQGYKSSFEGKAGNPVLTWEKEKKLNVGVDAKFANNKIGLILDIFNNSRVDILWNRGTVPMIIGAEMPAYNLGEMENKGFDGELSYTDKWGSVNVWSKANYTYARNKIIYQDEVERNENYLYRTGQSYGQFFGYVADGIFNAWEEVNAAGRPVYQWNNNKIQPGDIRYVDMNGDGKINDDDMVPIGYSNFPEVNFGLSFGASYKGFDFSVLFQGATNVSNNPSRRTKRGFYENTGAHSDLLKSWSQARFEANQEIVYPRFSVTNNTHNNVASTFWLEDASYVRLKNFEIGYTIKNKLLKNSGINTIRIYTNGSNLITWCKMLPGQDPESPVVIDNEEPYPATRVFNLGLNINF